MPLAAQFQSRKAFLLYAATLNKDTEKKITEALQVEVDKITSPADMKKLISRINENLVVQNPDPREKDIEKLLLIPETEKAEMKTHLDQCRYVANILSTLVQTRQQVLACDKWIAACRQYQKHLPENNEAIDDDLSFIYGNKSRAVQAVLRRLQATGIPPLERLQNARQVYQANLPVINAHRDSFAKRFVATVAGLLLGGIGALIIGYKSFGNTRGVGFFKQPAVEAKSILDAHSIKETEPQNLGQPPAIH